MGASYSFVCCSLLGGALSYPENEAPLLSPLLDSRSYQDKLKIFGACCGFGFFLFLFFYASCDWSLDYCGFMGVSSGKDWVLSALSGAMLGFGIVGLIFAYLRRSDNSSHAGSGYNAAPTQPAISMI
jgi:hypothetical protein